MQLRVHFVEYFSRIKIILRESYKMPSNLCSREFSV